MRDASGHQNPNPNPAIQASPYPTALITPILASPSSTRHRVPALVYDAPSLATVPEPDFELDALIATDIFGWITGTCVTVYADELASP